MKWNIPDLRTDLSYEFWYPRWILCLPSLHHLSLFGKYHHQLFTISFHESWWFQFFAGALKNVLSRQFGTFWARVGWVIEPKQLFCHSLTNTKSKTQSNGMCYTVNRMQKVSYDGKNNGQPNHWWHQNFFVGGIEGAKCISEGAKIQNFAKKKKMAEFDHFFLLMGRGQVGEGQSLQLGGGGGGANAPIPPLMPPLNLTQISHYNEDQTIYHFPCVSRNKRTKLEQYSRHFLEHPLHFNKTTLHLRKLLEVKWVRVLNPQIIT